MKIIADSTGGQNKSSQINYFKGCAAGNLLVAVILGKDHKAEMHAKLFDVLLFIAQSSEGIYFARWQ